MKSALLRRAGGSAGAGTGPDVLEDGPPLPIRVFVLDATEFAPLIESFQVTAFPTIMVFGKPGVAPFFSPGYLDEANFEQVLKAVAAARPEGEAPAQRTGPMGRLKSIVR